MQRPLTAIQPKGIICSGQQSKGECKSSSPLHRFTLFTSCMFPLSRGARDRSKLLNAASYSTHQHRLDMLCVFLGKWPVETNNRCLSEVLMFGESDALANLLRCCRPQPWMSMTRPAKPSYSPAESVAPGSHRQTGSLHSSSAFEASQQPQSETSSSSDTVETAQLAPVSRQMQHASGIRMSCSEGLFGRCDLLLRLL